MDNTQPQNDKLPALDWAGWVIAYTVHQGPVMQGYMGRMAKPSPDDTPGLVTLEDALEYVSMTQQSREGSMRTCHAGPIEYVANATTIQVRPVAILPLGRLSEGDLRTFTSARMEAAELARHLSAEPPRILGSDGGRPAGKSRLVGV